MRVFRNSREKKKAFCEAVQKEKEGTFFVMCFGNSRTEDKNSLTWYARDETVIKTVSSSFLRLQSTTISRTTLLLLLLLRGGRRL